MLTGANDAKYVYIAITVMYWGHHNLMKWQNEIWQMCWNGLENMYGSITRYSEVALTYMGEARP